MRGDQGVYLAGDALCMEATPDSPSHILPSIWDHRGHFPVCHRRKGADRGVVQFDDERNLYRHHAALVSFFDRACQLFSYLLLEC